MIDGIFKRLSPITAEGIHAQEIKKVDVEELSRALTAIKSDIEIAHLSFEKLYQEANYVHARLSHMENSMDSKVKAGVQQKSDDKDGEVGGDTGSGTRGIIVEKVMAIGNSADPRLHERVSKIKEAKALTASLLEAIEKLSLNVQKTSEAQETTRLKM